MKTAVTAIVAAIEAAAIALAVFLLVAVPVLLMWAVTFQLAATPQQVLQICAALWELVLRVPLSFTLDATAAQAFALTPEPLQFNVSLPPALLTLVPVLLAARMGGRMVPRGRAGQVGLASALLVFTALSLIPAVLAQPVLGVPLWQAALRAGAVFAIPAILTYLARGSALGEAWWEKMAQGVRRFAKESMGEKAGDFFLLASHTIRLLTATVLAVFAAGGILFAVAVVAGYAGAIELAQQLQLDGFGAVVVFGAQFAYLPVWVLWTLGWFSGAGVDLGVGNHASPFAAPDGVLPTLPVLGLLPDGVGSLGSLAPCAVVLAGIVTGVLFARRYSVQLGNRVFIAPLTAGVLSVPVLAAVFWFASGAAGPGTLSRVGVSPWVGAGFVALEATIGLLLGVFLNRLPWDEWGVSRALAKVRRGKAADSRKVAASEPWLEHVQEDLAGLETMDLSEVRRQNERAAAESAAEQGAAETAPEVAAPRAGEKGRTDAGARAATMLAAQELVAEEQTAQESSAQQTLSQHETQSLSEAVRRARLAVENREETQPAESEEVLPQLPHLPDDMADLPEHSAADARREAAMYSEEELLAAFSWDTGDFSQDAPASGEEPEKH